MPENDLKLLIDAAHQAAEIATTYIGGALDITLKEHDNSPVTAADLAVDAALGDMLRTARADYGWLSEESVDNSARLDSTRTFILDPIDGTRSFIAGEDTWAHSLAIVENGQPIAAVVYLPMKDKLYTAARGHGAYLNQAPIAVTDARDLTSAKILTTKPNLDPKHWPNGVPDIRRSHRPSLAYRLSLVAEGRYDAMFTFRPSWEWDIAAGALILSEAGASVTDKAGEALRFNAKHPQTNGIVAGAPALHADILSRL